MATAVVMPKAGITVKDCIISEWLKKPGDQVETGEVLFTYETDKASFECESTAAGELLECFFDAGDEVECLTNVCAIGKAGEDVSGLRPAGAALAAPASAPAAQAPAAQATAAPVQVAPAQPAAAAASAPFQAAGISPRARGLAERAGVDASQAAPTGPNGRVIERDVRQLIAEGPAAVQAASKPAPSASAAPIAPDTEYEDVKFSGIRKAIAKSMYTSLTTMAQLTHHHSFDATEIQSYRAMLKGKEGETAGITLGDMVLFAVSRTLGRHPDLNAHMIDESTIRRFGHVNLGVAINTDRGLMVPTIFRAEEKSLLQISKEVKELAAMCRSGSINPDLLQGGSFTVSNLGATGVEIFTPVVNPPQTGILGVCTMVQRVRKGKDGGMELYPAMGLSLTYDHRAVDGFPASQFVAELCRNLENFTALLAR